MLSQLSRFPQKLSGFTFHVLALWAVVASAAATPLPDRGALQFDSLPRGHFQFTGPVGERVQANVDNWLLRAPQANPGMLEMFVVRDRQPAPQLVPWAGEFVGKYLISAVQALRMTDDPRLRLQVSNVVAAFIATQAEDGYLGPFPQNIRLLKYWDLWGHYHALTSLLMWHQHTGDPAALAAARKTADLVCRTYLDSGRRVLDAGDPEMNMTILTGMAMLYRLTSEPRYLRMAHEVEKDWERAGDYLRAGLDGREFFQCPRPRWESLHDLQGLFELWRITGDAKYRDAFVHHWRSIRRWDRRNTGAFSSGEQATGNPYAPTAIETCCTVAWMTLTADYLRLTADPRAADDLELATLNGGLGAQHPSGRWWTYNTPMDGVREASAHSIVFQARAGTPELNCCSVNGPRVLGLLSEWAVMSAPDGLVVNSYLPGTFTLPGSDGAIRMVMDRHYPLTSSQRIIIKQTGRKEWTLRLRIPAWSTHTRVAANFKGVPTDASAGSYLEIRRRWKAGDEVTLQFDFTLRAIAGANEAAGKVSLYRGPLLLAYDQAHNTFDEADIPALDLARLNQARMVAPLRTPHSALPTLQHQPWLQVDLPTDNGSVLRLVDFASAGMAGTRYRSWLAALKPPPPPSFTQYPRDGERIRPGPTRFQWRGPRRSADVGFRVEIAGDAGFRGVLLATNSAAGSGLALDLAALPTATGPDRWWRVITVGPNGEALADVPPARFVLAADAPIQALPPESKAGPNGELVIHSLRGDQPPKFGQVLSANFESRGAEGTRVNGRDQRLVYAVPAWPEEDFTVAVRVRIEEIPTNRLGQIFSAWAGGMDDPLRLVVENDKLFARIEAGGGFGTPGVPLDTGRWHQVAAVKRGATLTLVLDSQPAGSCPAPEFSMTAARDCALGGNPHFTGNEFLAATFADFGLWNRALSIEDLRQAAPAAPSLETFTFKTFGDHGEGLQADVHRPQGDAIRPVVLFIHGGALMAGDRKLTSRPGSLLRTLLDAGYVVVSIDYRLAPNVKLPQIIEDVRDACEWVRKRLPEIIPIDPEQLVVMGQSAGGYLTQMTGFCVQPRPRALVSFWGYGDIAAEWYSRPDPFYCQQPLVTKEQAEAPGSRLLYLYCRQQGLWPKVVAGHDPDTEPRAFDPFCPVRNVTREYPPTLFIHGTKDTDVPYALSVQMDQELTAKGVEHQFVTIPEGGHGFRSKEDAEIATQTYRQVVEFLKKNTKR